MLLELGFLAFLASVASASQDPCTLPKEVGVCRALKLRFHFNQNSGKCEAFMYGGCRGNSNNFESLLECHITCAHMLDHYTTNEEAVIHVKNSHCLLPPLQGILDFHLKSHFKPYFTSVEFVLKPKYFLKKYFLKSPKIISISKVCIHVTDGFRDLLLIHKA